MGRSRFDCSAERFDDESGVYTRLRVMTYYRSLRMTQTYRSADVQWDVSAEQSEDGGRHRFRLGGPPGLPDGSDMVNVNAEADRRVVHGRLSDAAVEAGDQEVASLVRKATVTLIKAIKVDPDLLNAVDRERA